MYRNNMRLYTIDSGNFMVDGGAMFGVIPKSLWSKYYPCDEKNMCNLANRCLLIETNEKKILIDTGIGEKQDEKYLAHFYLNGNTNLINSLNKAGFHTGDITDIILTHLHWDHCGGALAYNDNSKTIEVFPNAHYWVSKKQWDWANNPNKREKAAFLQENILPLSDTGKLHFIEKNVQWTSEIELRLYDGHTIGQIVPFINTGKRTLVFMADLIPSVAHIPLPYLAAYDIHPLTALKEKEDFLSEAVDNSYVLFFEHDIRYETCTVQQTIKGIREDTCFKLSEWENLF